uniref:peptidylprolyl isomerase n=1 Tax=Pararhizobium sp. IMCC3301 TaxID=3067904 RepID=UPI0027404D13|nr:peptidylprolyl isomerase [Pararhizobium sp. IMCC3301]
MLAIRHSFVTLTMAGVFALGLAQSGFAQEKPMENAPDPDALVLTVGDTKITEQDLSIANQDFAEILQDIPEAERREKLIELLIDMQIFAQEARKTGLGDSKTFKRRVKLMEARALRNAYFEKEILEAVSDDEIKARYEVEIGKLTPDVTVSARHILVKEEDEAKKIIEELQAGADFETLAKERSTGPSGPSGGDLGEFSRGQMVPTFEAAAFALEPGSITSEPVQTQFGWHVIQVYEKGSAPLPTFEEAEEGVRNVVISERFTEKLNTLREEYDVERATE